MSTPAEQALLAEILTNVRAVDAKVSGIEVTVAQALAELKHSTSQVADHEARIRTLEAVDVVTKDELTKSQAERTARFRWQVTSAIAVVGLIQAIVTTLIVRG